MSDHGSYYVEDTDWDHEDDEHGYDCDCEDCELERAMDEYGELPAHLGGGCSMAGSEYCDFDCPFRDAMCSEEE